MMCSEGHMEYWHKVDSNPKTLSSCVDHDNEGLWYTVKRKRFKREIKNKEM